MAMVCPKCSGAFEQRLQCPQCAVRLQYHAVHPARQGSATEADRWQQTPWGRLVVGLLLSQGLYYVLKSLCTAGLLALREGSVGNVWATLTALILLQGLQAVSVLAAGLVIGAAQRRGFLFGAVVGVWNSVLYLGAQYGMGQPFTVITLVGDPILQVAFGAVGGLIGSLIWKPVPDLTLPGVERGNRPLIPVRKTLASLSGPVAWGRVVAGIALAVGGVVWADVIREFVLDASEGTLKIESRLQADLVTAEIAALAMLAGGGLAGSTTRNGLKQGLCAGIGIGVVLGSIRLASAHGTVTMALLTLAGALALGLVGGWFGSELLPPVHGPARRRRQGAYS
jgi:hypothetical protein